MFIDAAVYVAVRCLSVSLSVPLIDSSSDVQLLSSDAGGSYRSLTAVAVYRLSISAPRWCLSAELAASCCDPRDKDRPKLVWPLDFDMHSTL